MIQTLNEVYICSSKLDNTSSTYASSIWLAGFLEYFNSYLSEIAVYKSSCTLFIFIIYPPISRYCYVMSDDVKIGS